MLVPWKKSYDQPIQHIKKQRHYFTNKGPSGQSYSFSSSHVWMWELDYKESSVSNNWCFCTVVLEKTLENPLDCKEIQPVNPKGNQSWIFIVKLKLKLQYYGHWCEELTHWKRPWCWERLKAEERDYRGWDGWMASPTRRSGVWATPGVGYGRGSLQCWSPWGHKESDMTEQLNWTDCWLWGGWSQVSYRWAMQNIMLHICNNGNTLQRENPSKHLLKE